MNAVDRTGTLPAPHEHIAINIRRWIGNKIHVVYAARPSDLHRAGIVTKYMQEKIMNQHAGRMLDEKGRPFRLIRTGRFKNKLEIWESREPISVQFVVYEQDALELPGVRELGLPDDDEDESLELLPRAEQFVQLAIHAGVSDGWKHRDRAVGRYQRLVRWVVIDNVIWPDWREVRSGFSSGMKPQAG